LTVYEKGSEVIRMMHNLLGEEGFQKGMKLYFERHDGTAATCEDFVAAMEDASGVDLKHFRLILSFTIKMAVLLSYAVTLKKFIMFWTNAEQTFVFENVEERPVISMLREFSAPVKLNYEYSDEDLSFLMVHARNDFARWDAGQMLLARDCSAILV
jgi:aminopeptidase N